MALDEECNNKFQFVWKIQNYLQCKSDEISLQSPIFSAYSVGHEWYLKLLTRDENNYVTCRLYRNDASCDNVKDLIISADIVDIESNTWHKIGSKRVLLEREGFETVFQVSAASLENEMSNWSRDVLTIRLFMWTSETLNHCESNTDGHLVIFPLMFDWHSKIPIETQRQTFVINQKYSVEASLVLREDNILIKIKYNGAQLSLKVTLFNVLYAVVFSKAFSHTFNKVGEEWTLPYEMSRFLLRSPESQCLDSLGQFHLRFEIFSMLKHQKSYSFDALSSSFKDLKHLKSDLRKLFSSKMYADVQLRIDGKTLYFHKCILSARSPVFAAMFDHPMLESCTGVVDITDLDEDTLNSLILFMYTGSLLNMNYENAFKLLMAANKYQVLCLKEKCISFLISRLNTGNACNLLKTGDIIEHEILKNSAFDHIILNAPEFLQNPDWNDWLEMNPKLGSEILLKLSASKTRKRKTNNPWQNEVFIVLQVNNQYPVFGAKILEELVREIWTILVTPDQMKTISET